MDRRKTRIRSDVKPGMLAIKPKGKKGWFVPYDQLTLNGKHLCPFGQFTWALIGEGQSVALIGVVVSDMFGTTGNLEGGGPDGSNRPVNVSTPKAD
jgi:hypothetical protein